MRDGKRIMILEGSGDQIGTLDRGEIQGERKYWRMQKVERDGSKRKAGKRLEVGETE